MLPFLLFAQQKFTISGFVKDATNGEALIGATVLVKELGSGNITNVYGFYSITIPSGEYVIEYSYVGFKTQNQKIELNQNQRIDIELGFEDKLLDEVVITAEAADQNVTSAEMSVAKLDISTISKMPAVFGEVDIIKSLQLLPGVSTVGEGASGYNVRGGTVGQNLILLDEAPVYNSSHLLGFFSVFNPDAVKDVKLSKGAIPAQYGGRVSSVLDVRMKEGNSKAFEYNGGLGTIFGRFAAEGPIIDDKMSFIVAGRRSWIDGLLKPTGILESGDALYFYDLTIKTNYKIDDKNQLFLSGYLGRDVFSFTGAGFDWGNGTGTLRWNHLFNDRLFMNLSMIYSEYDYALEFGEEVEDSFMWDSKIRNFDFKPQFSYFINSNNELQFGGEFLDYTFEPANAIGNNDGTPIDFSLPEKYAVEGNLYINNIQKVSDKLTLNYGIRFSGFNFVGPADVFVLEDGEPGERKNIVDTVSYSDGDLIKSYSNPEPRVGFTYILNSTSSIKGSYNRMAQYIHLLSISTASNPLDLWIPSSNNLEPETADLFSLGYFRNLKENQYELSAEAYYRTVDNQLDYRNGVSTNDILLNEAVEREILSAESRSYGLELYAKRNTGRLNGWVSYTISKSEIRTYGLNNDDWYDANHDQLHNFKIAAFYDWKKNVQLSANFVYTTGRPYTAPNQTYSALGGETIAFHNSLGDRNANQNPDYHRLDLSATFQLTKPNKLFNRNYESNLVVSIYNIYSRRNAFSIYPSFGDQSLGESADPVYNRFSVIGFILPSITYNFKF